MRDRAESAGNQAKRNAGKAAAMRGVKRGAKALLSLSLAAFTALGPIGPFLASAATPA
jgi:hypothetical protein